MSQLRLGQRIERRLIRRYFWYRRRFRIILNRLIRYMDEKPNRFYDREFTFEQIFQRFGGSKGDHGYHYFDCYFRYRAPKWLRESRLFYGEHGSFGEDAFHAMWYKLWIWYAPKRCLEVGVYKGQIISLWKMLGIMTGLKPERVCGLSTFDGMGDSVSKYVVDDYLSEVRDLCFQCGIDTPELIKLNSASSEGKEFIESGLWDLIYLDGSHDYDIVLSDYQSSKKGLVTGGLLVMDDSSLYLDGIPSSTETRSPGHPGPSKIVAEIASKELKHLLTVGHNNVFQKT